MASLHVKDLEQALAVTLLVRSTRTISLTELGQAFYTEFKRLLGEVDNAFEQVLRQRDRIAGTLRLSTTSEYGERFILPLIPAFMARYPELSISYDINSSLSDLIAEKLDLVVRLGGLADSSFRSRQLDAYDIVLVASPDLLRRHCVAAPAELAGVPWIANSNLRRPTGWTLTDGGGNAVEVTGAAICQSNSSTAIRAMAVAGLGVAVLPAWLITAELAAGTLQRVLPGYALPRQPISIVYPNSSHVPHKTRAFIDFLRTHLAPVNGAARRA